MNSFGHGDYHLHSSTLSDGLNSIDEIDIQAGFLNYREIALTDHNLVILSVHEKIYSWSSESLKTAYLKMKIRP